MKNKLYTIISLLISDVALALYTYYTLSNFDQFKKILGTALPSDSADFQLDLYRVFLQTIIFISMILIFFHIVIFYYYFKEKKFAKNYVRFYSGITILSLIFSVFFFRQFALILPCGMYMLGLHYSLKSFPKTVG